MRVGFFGVRRRGQLRARGRGATTARVAKESVIENNDGLHAITYNSPVRHLCVFFTI